MNGSVLSIQIVELLLFVRDTVYINNFNDYQLSYKTLLTIPQANMKWRIIVLAAITTLYSPVNAHSYACIITGESGDDNCPQGSWKACVCTNLSQTLPLRISINTNLDF